MEGQKVEYMKLYIQVCSTVSMWPLPRDETNKWKIIRHKISVLIITLLLLLLLIPLTLKIVVDYQDMDGIATAIDFATVFASGLFRYVYIYIRSDRYLNLIEIMYSKFTYTSFYPEDKKVDMGKYIKIAKFIGLGYLGCSLAWVIQIVLFPIILHGFGDKHIANMSETEIPLAFTAHYPFALTQQTAHGMVYTFQVLAGTLLGVVYLSSDSFWYVIIILTIGQLDLVFASLKGVESQWGEEREEGKEIEEGEGRGEGEGKEEEEEEIRHAVVKCIKQHQEIRIFMEEIENIISPIILVDFMHALISITFLLLDLTIAITLRDWMRISNTAQYFMISIIHMFLIDYLGNELTAREEALSTAIYSIPWYQHPAATSLSVTMCTHQARKPFRLTGGHMYYVSLEFFVATIKTIFSYFTVLRQLRDEKG